MRGNLRKLQNFLWKFEWNICNKYRQLNKPFQSFHCLERKCLSMERERLSKMNHPEDTFVEPSQKTFFKKVKSVIKTKET